MELLYGDNDVAGNYQVSGIPTLVVIDKEGKIRYRKSGAEEALDEKLQWIVDAIK